MTTFWTAVAVTLAVVGLAPSLWIASRGEAHRRLLGLELAGAVTVMLLLALSAAFRQTSYLIVPLVLAVLAFTGTLVFTRLLGPHP